MKRICILPIFDADGIFDESLFFYLDSISKVAQRIIVVVIGGITEESLNGLKKYTDEILVKDNRGFDAGAIKWCLKKYLTLQELNSYDELILSNDTNFGPFVPFAEIFAQMERCDCEFWGITFTDRNLEAHLVSDFRVYKKRTFSFVYNYILSEVKEKNTDRFYAELDYEYRMHKKAVQEGFHFSSYNAVRHYSMYCRPYSALKDGCPFVKVRSFTFTDENPNECLDALSFISSNSDYDVLWIKKRIWRKYKIDIDSIKPEPHPIEKSLDFFAVNEADFKALLSRFDNVYIYGVGNFAKYLYYYYQEEFCNFAGFVVSDNYSESKKQMLEKPVLRLSDISDKSALIIIAMTKENTAQVLPLLTGYQNVVNLWEPLPASNSQPFEL